MKAISVSGRGLSKMCRLCLTGDVKLINLYVFSTKLEGRIVDSLIKCAPIHITRNDDLPQFICKICYIQLERINKFRRDAVKSESILRRHLKVLNSFDLIQHETEYLKDMSTQNLIDCKENQHSETNNQEFSDFAVKVEASFDVGNPKRIDTSKHKTKQNVKFKVPSRVDQTSEYSNEFKPENIITATGANISTTSNVKEEEIEETAIDEDSFGNDCDFLTETKSELNFDCIKINLTELIHNTVKSYQCDNCKMEFECENQLLNHKQIHLSTSKSKKRKTVRSKRSKIDQPTITKNKQSDNKQKCRKTTREKQSTLLVNSTNDIDQKNHTGDTSFRCGTCKLCLSESGDPDKHPPVSIRPYQCDECGKSFTKLWNLKHHKLVHTGERPYKCAACDKGFTNSSYLKIHERQHTGERPYRCDVCNKCFISPSDLKVHQRTHTGEKPYHCNICEKSFVISNHLTLHKRMHTGERPYRCEVCGKCFTHSSSLKIHNRLHTGEKPHQCDVCSKSFTQLNSLKTHQRLHTNEKLNENVI